MEGGAGREGGGRREEGGGRSHLQCMVRPEAYPQRKGVAEKRRAANISARDDNLGMSTTDSFSPFSMHFNALCANRLAEKRRAANIGNAHDRFLFAIFNAF